jgi:hypothetical protein
VDNRNGITKEKKKKLIQQECGYQKKKIERKLQKKERINKI